MDFFCPGCSSWFYNLPKIYNRKFFINNYKFLFKKISKYGGEICLHFIGGNPLETEDDFLKNCNFCKELKFDPSGKSPTSIFVYYLAFFPGATILKKFPEIKNYSRSLLDYQYKSALMDIRRVLPDEEFERIAADSYYKKHPEKLSFLQNIIERDLSNKYITDQAERLKGKEVFFWGSGDIYRYKKHIFSQTKPKAIIVDRCFKTSDSIDGINVILPDDIYCYNKILPIIIFSKNARMILFKIKCLYPEFDDIVLCQSL